jgi:hypothetical protein
LFNSASIASGFGRTSVLLLLAQIVNARLKLRKGPHSIDQSKRLYAKRQRLPVRPQALPPHALDIAGIRS